MINPSELNLSTLPWLPLEAKSAFPRQPAIYFAIDAQNSIQYIGRSVDPKIRWTEHHRYGQLTAIGGIRVAYLFVDSPDLISEIESALIGWFQPPLNVVGCDRAEPVAVSNVAVLRERAKLTQRELADLVGVTESTIRNLERNRNGVDQIERVVKLCKALNCSADELIQYVEVGGAGTHD